MGIRICALTEEDHMTYMVHARTHELRSRTHGDVMKAPMYIDFVHILHNNIILLTYSVLSSICILYRFVFFFLVFFLSFFLDFGSPEK